MGAVLQLSCSEGLISHTYTLGPDPLTLQSAAANEAQGQFPHPYDLQASFSTHLGSQLEAISPPPIPPKDGWGQLFHTGNIGTGSPTPQLRPDVLCSLGQVQGSAFLHAAAAKGKGQFPRLPQVTGSSHPFCTIIP